MEDKNLFPNFGDFLIKSDNVPQLDLSKLNSEILDNNVSNISGNFEIFGAQILVLSYKGKIGYILSFDEEVDNKIVIKQMHRAGKNGFRIGEALDCLGYCLQFLVINYINKGIPVTVEDIENLDNDPSFNKRYNQFTKYRILKKHLEQFCREKGILK